MINVISTYGECDSRHSIYPRPCRVQRCRHIFCSAYMLHEPRAIPCRRSEQMKFLWQWWDPIKIIKILHTLKKRKGWQLLGNRARALVHESYLLGSSQWSTSVKLLRAPRATFHAKGWRHESTRGWQSGPMVQLLGRINFKYLMKTYLRNDLRTMLAHALRDCQSCVLPRSTRWLGGYGQWVNQGLWMVFSNFC
jgi:hypothetical protein